MGVTASQIRQDLNNFGEFGQQGYGYNVEYLYTSIGKILGLEKEYNIIIIGVGNLGQALANYIEFERKGFKVKGLFDVNPRLIGMIVRDIEIRDVSEIERFMQENSVDIAVLTLPKQKAPEMAVNLEKWGVKGIWNFAPIDLHSSSDKVCIENVHLSESLMTLSYAINEKLAAKGEKH